MPPSISLRGPRDSQIDKARNPAEARPPDLATAISRRSARGGLWRDTQPKHDSVAPPWQRRTRARAPARCAAAVLPSFRLG